MLTVRFLILAALFGAVMYGDDITLPLDDGTILIRARFIRVTEFGVYVPELAIELRNQTSSSWRTLKLRFDIGGSCNGEPRQWTVPTNTSLDHKGITVYKETVIPLIGNIDGCKSETIRVGLVLAESSKVRIDGVTGERVDLEKQREAQAKKDAAEAARRKRMAAEQKRKQAEADARYAKAKAEEDAKAAEERRKIRTACMAIYQSTIDKKIKDLTVREEQQVRACQGLGLYPPQ